MNLSKSKKNGDKKRQKLRVMMRENEVNETVVLSLFGQPLVPPPLSDAARKLAENNLATARENYEADSNLENTIWYGRRLAYLFQFEKALAVYTDGIARFPQAHQLYRHRGHRYISTRQLERAVTDLARAAELAADQPVTVEPDGIPNKLNRPLSNSHFNIWYHLGLAYYLLGQWQSAVGAYQTCLQYCDNPDLLTATVDWLYMTYRRLGDEAAARELLALIDDEMVLVESPVYYNRLMMYKGRQTAESLLNPVGETAEDRDIAIATQGYGVGNWYLYHGDTRAALEVFAQVLQSQNWSAFGYIAAEVEIRRLGHDQLPLRPISKR
jgi:tetratricopeptide (TPR) repeat protein